MFFGFFCGVVGTIFYYRFKAALIGLFKSTEDKVEKAIKDASK